MIEALSQLYPQIEGQSRAIEQRKDGWYVNNEKIEITPEIEALQVQLTTPTYKDFRRDEYQKKSPYEQIEMMADGTFNEWYQSVKAKYPKP